MAGSARKGSFKAYGKALLITFFVFLAVLFNFGAVAGEPAGDDDEALIPDDIVYPEPLPPPSAKSPWLSAQSSSFSSLSASSATQYKWTVSLYKVYIYDDHDGVGKGCGEWKFNTYADGSYRDPSDQFSRCGAGYIDPSGSTPITSWSKTSTSSFSYIFYAGEYDFGNADFYTFSKWHDTQTCSDIEINYHYDRDPSDDDVKFYIKEVCEEIVPETAVSGFVRGPHRAVELPEDEGSGGDEQTGKDADSPIPLGILAVDNGDAAD